MKDVAKMVNQFEKKNKIKFYVNENRRTKKKTLRFDYGKMKMINNNHIK